MYHHNVKLNFKSCASTLLAVVLMAGAVSTQTTSPTYPRWPDIKRQNPRTINAQDLGTNGTNANGQRPSVKDLMLGEEPPSPREDLKRGNDKSKTPAQQKVNPDRAGVSTIPHWSDTYTYQGLTYKYTMVGTDPKRGSATTTIPTVLIPIRFVFEEDGTVMDASTDLIDGRTAIQGIVNSPIFQPYGFNVGGISVGNTQFGDAFQRAEFWDSVSTGSRDYHVILGQPTIAPVFEVLVPTAQLIMETNGRRVAIMGFDFLKNAALAALSHANASPQTLPIVVWGNVYVRTYNTLGLSGFHGAYEVPGGVQTYIATSYHPATGYFNDDPYNIYLGSEDTNSLSRQVVSWLNDPFNGNFTPGWNVAEIPSPICWSERTSDLMEVADVDIYVNTSEVPPTTITTDSGTYHLTEAAFLDYFTRASRSRSANGQYSFFRLFDGYGFGNSPSSPCTGHVEIDSQVLEFPNAASTRAFGINNNGWIVGSFRDASQRGHAFVYDGRNFTQLDYPGAESTVAYKINDAGQLVGFYWDSAGLPHGFSYFQGSFIPISFPGSIDNTSVALGINNQGDIVGLYDATVEITHGFIYQNGQFRTLDTPFAAQTEVRAINDHGLTVGDAYDDPFDYVTGFSLDRNVFTRFAFSDAFWTLPWTVNNLGMQGGTFNGNSSFRGVSGLTGYVTIYGYPYEVHSDVYGMNDKGQIVGDTRDASSGRIVGYVATLPK